MPSCHSKYITHDCHCIGHTWEPSCVIANIHLLGFSFKYALKIYTPIYVVSALLTKKRKEYFLKQLYKEILRSSAFLAGNSVFMLFFFCLIRKIFGRFYVPTLGIIPGFLASFCAIMIERKSRRGALAIYMLNQGFDTTFNMLKAAGLAKHIEYGEVMIFSTCTAILLYMYRTNNLPDGFIKSILNFFFKKDSSDISNHYQPSNKVSTNEIKQSLQLTSKAFGIGYVIQASYFLIMALPKLFKKPNQFFRAFVRPNNFKVGAFLGGLVGLAKLVEKLLSEYTKSSLKSLLAGGVAGCSMVVYRSSTIALYILSKTLELLYLNGIEKGFFPYVKHFDTILYTCCTALMFHAALLQPLYLKPTYWQFLIKLTGEKFAHMNRKGLESFGYDSAKIDRLGLVRKSWSHADIM